MVTTDFRNKLYEILINFLVRHAIIADLTGNDLLEIQWKVHKLEMEMAIAP